MAIHSSTFKPVIALGRMHEGDKELYQIVSQIDQYLLNFGHSWIFLALGKSYFQRCCRSWTKVTIHLEKFLTDPRTNYSMLIGLLEQELEKFPQNSFYAKKLKLLERLVSMGPNFSQTEINH